jgi:hypothetical protein
MSTTQIPPARDDDPEDVSWALSTAATSFARGDRAEALKWLRRAAEAASEAERDTRALELAKAAAELSPPSVAPPAPSVPPSVVPPPVSSKGPPPLPSSPPPLPSSPPPLPSSPPARASAPVPPPSRPSAPAPRPSAPASRPSSPASKPAAKASSPAPTKRAGIKPAKAADETSKRPAVKPKLDHRTRPRIIAAQDEPTDTHVITEVTKLDTKPPAAAQVSEAEAWPTESMDSAQFDALHDVYGQERTRIGAPPYKQDKLQFRASQAVHVVLWRDADGTLRIAPRGTSVSAVTIEALLVAPGPDVDLIAWLSS